MVDFNGFDKGVIGKKLPSDSTLNQMKKSELIELLHLAESNHRVLAETYKIAVDTSKCKSCPLTLDEKDRRQVRTEAIDEYKKKIEFEYKWLLGKPVEPNVGIAFNTLISYAEQMKEQKNE